MEFFDETAKAKAVIKGEELKPKDWNFCSKCGTRMRWKLHVDGYNTVTGIPNEFSYWECDNMYRDDRLNGTHDMWRNPFKGNITDYGHYSRTVTSS